MFSPARSLTVLRVSASKPVVGDDLLGGDEQVLRRLRQRRERVFEGEVQVVGQPRETVPVGAPPSRLPSDARLPRLADRGTGLTSPSGHCAMEPLIDRSISGRHCSTGPRGSTMVRRGPLPTVRRLVDFYTGRVLRLDLTALTATVEPLDEEWARLYVGGKGLLLPLPLRRAGARHRRARSGEPAHPGQRSRSPAPPRRRARASPWAARARRRARCWTPTWAARSPRSSSSPATTWWS